MSDKLPDNPQMVRITSQRLENDVLALLGPSEPELTGGEGGWDVVGVPDGVGLTEWSGIPPYQMTIDLMLDNYLENAGESVSAQVRRIRKLAQPQEREKKPDRDPPKMRVWGRGLPLSGETWVLDQPQWGRAERARNGRLLRQEVTLTFIEFNKGDQIKIRRKGGKKKTKRYTVKKGDTLQKIAAKFYDDHKKWKKIKKANPKKCKNPRKLKVGMVLKIP